MVERKVKVRLEAEDRASKKIGGVGNTLKTLGAVAVAVGVVQLGKVLVGGFKSVINAAAEFESEIVRLDQALRNSGQFTDAASEELKIYAKELQKVSVASETQILQAQAMALNMGATVRTAKAAAQAATNLAASIGVDLETAVRQINKTLGGYAGELGEVIPELKDLTAEQLRAGAGADLINEKFRGAALTLAGTFAGSVNNLETALNQLSVTLGKEFTPALAEMAKVVTGLAGVFDETLQGGNLLRSMFINLNISILGMVENLIVAARGFAEFKALFRGGLTQKERLFFGGLQAEIQDGIFALNELKKLMELKPDALGDPDLRPLVPVFEIPDVDGVIEPVLEIEERFERVNEQVRVLSAEELPLVIDSMRALGDVSEEAVDQIVGVATHLIRLGDSATNAFLDLGDAAIDGALGADIAWGDFFKSLLANILKAQLEMLILNAISAGATGGASSAFGGVTGVFGIQSTGPTLGAPALSPKPVLSQPTLNRLAESATPASELHIHLEGAMFLDEGMPPQVARQIRDGLDIAEDRGLVRRRDT